AEGVESPRREPGPPVHVAVHVPAAARKIAPAAPATTACKVAASPAHSSAATREGRPASAAAHMTAASAAKSTTSAATAVADENDGAGGAAETLEIDRRRRRRSLNDGQEKQTARQSGHSRHGCSHDKTPIAWDGGTGGSSCRSNAAC